MATYTKSVTKTQYASEGWTYINFDAITPAAGEEFVRWKAEQSSGSGQIELRDLNWTPRTWGSWYTEPSQINCSSGFSAPKIQARFNASSGTLNVTYTLTLEFTQTTFTITVTAGTGGTAVTSKATAQAGETVTITCSPAAGYSADTPTATGITFAGSGTNIWTFTMPAADTAVSCTFTKIDYTVTGIANPAGAGTISISPSTANYGDTVTISQTPGSEYVFDGWIINPPAQISGGQFTMPAQNVTLTANYKKKSTCTLSTSSMTGGSNVILNITPGNLSYSHKYKLSFGTNMETAEVSVAAGVTSVTIQVPESWSQQIPNAATKTGGTLVLSAYDGTTLVATYTVSGLTYNVPASAVPEIGTITTSIITTVGGQSYFSPGAYYVQNKSAVRTQASATGALGSTVASMEVILGGYSDNDHKTTVSAASVDYTSGLLSNAGTCTITVRATDSRGRTGMKTAMITVQPYNRPAGSLRVWRVDANGDDDPMGSYADYELTKSYTQIGTNALTWSITSQGSTASSPADTGHLLPGSRQTFADTTEYTITLTLTDSFSETVQIQVKLPTAQFMIFVNANGDRIAFMKAANENLSKNGKNGTIEFSDNHQIYIGSVTLEQYILNVVNGN